MKVSITTQGYHHNLQTSKLHGKHSGDHTKPPIVQYIRVLFMDCLICSCTYVAWFELGTYLEHFFLFFYVSVLLLWVFWLGKDWLASQAFFSCWAGGGGGGRGA